MVACQKDNNDILVIEGEQYSCDAKMHLDDLHYSVWDDGDSIEMNGTDYKVNVGETSSTITGSFGEGPYYAIYPARMATNTNTLTMPAVQRYRTANGKQIIDAPMYGYSNGTGSLKFHNLGSVLAVNVTNSTSENMTVQSIEVIAENNVALCGSATITNQSSDNPTMTISSGSNTVTLKGINVTLAANESKIFYVALPVISGAKLTIKVTDEYFNYSRTQGTATASFARNTAHEVAFTTSGITPVQYKPLSNQVFYVTNNNQTFTSGLDYGSMEGKYFGDAECKSDEYHGSYGILTYDRAITSTGNDNSYPLVDNHNVTKIILPESISGTMSNYTISSIQNLTDVNIPSGITTLNSIALNDLNSLQHLRCYRTTPPTISGELFWGYLSAPTTVVLHVPSGCIPAYESWRSHFANIIDDL